jgi:hypothetical protein
MPQPIYQYIVADADIGQSIDLGNQIGILLDGTASFSFTCWVRVRALANQANLLLKANELSLTISGPFLAVQLAGQASPVVSDLPIVEDQWHYVAATFDLSQGAGLVTLYLDGVQVGQSSVSNVGTASTGSHYVLGGGLNLEFLSMTFYASALPPYECVQDWTSAAPADSGSPPSPVPVANFDFASVPARDLAPAANPVTLLAGAQQTAVTPALSLYGSWATPSAADALNPGGGASPFSVQAWILPFAPTPEESSQVLTILANGSQGSAGCFTLTLTYDPTAGNFTLAAKAEGPAPFSLSGAGLLSPGAWANVAVTYDGSTVTLYLNGVAIGSAQAGALATLVQPLVTIGVTPDPTAPGGVDDFFKGGIQAAAIWTTLLSPPDIVTYTAQPWGGQPGCAAYFDFSNGDLSNQVTGSPIQLYETADVVEIMAPAAPSASLSPSRRAGTAPAGLVSPFRTWHATLHTLGIDGETRPPGAAIDDAAIDSMLSAYDERVSVYVPSVAQWLSNTHRRNLYATLELQSRQPGPPPGTFTHTLEGDHWVIWHHDGNGKEEAVRFPAAEISECTTWAISLFVTCLGLIVTVLGAAYNPTRLAQAAAAQVVANPPLLAGAAQVLAQPTTAMTIVKLVRVFYAGASLSTVVTNALTGVGFWSWAFTVTSLILQIVALWLSGGWYASFVIAQLVFGLVHLSVIIANQPAGCCGKPAAPAST